MYEYKLFELSENLKIFPGDIYLNKELANYFSWI